MKRYRYLVICAFFITFFHGQSFGLTDCLELNTSILVDEESPISLQPKEQKESIWSSYIGMGVGYLPFGYHEFTPAFGVYFRDAVFNEVFNAAFINVIYKDMFMLENRLQFTHSFGYYHDYYNTFYNHVYLGFNPLPLAINKDVKYSLFIKYGFGVTNNCNCSADVPFRRPGMISSGVQIDFLTPLNDFLKLHLSFGNNIIHTDVPGRSNFTHWHVGVAMRLM